MSYKYKELADIIINDILSNYNTGDKYISQRELQYKYNSSVSTVQKAIEIIVSKGFLNIVKGQGAYVSKDNTSNVKYKNYIIIHRRDISVDSHFDDFNNELINCLSEKYVSISFFQYKDLSKLLNTSGYDGIIFVAPIETDYYNINKFIAKKIPTVITGNNTSKLKSTYIDTDIELGMDLVLEEFSKLGIKNIGSVNYYMELQHDRLRRNYLIAHAKDYGITIKDKWVVTYYDGYIFGEQQQEALKNILLDNNRPEALFFNSNYLLIDESIDFIKTLGFELGKGIHIAGFDAPYFSKYIKNHEVIAVKQNMVLIADKCIEALEALEKNQIFDRKVLIAPTLIPSVYK